MRSIRRHLLVALVLALSSSLLVGAYGTYSLARQEASELFDYHLRQLALSLRDQSFAMGANTSILPNADFDFVIQIWDGEGKDSYFSNSKMHLPLQEQQGFRTVETADGRWRIFSIRTSERTIQVAHPRHVRDELAASMAWRVLMPFVWLLPVLAGLIWWIVGRGMAPLARIADSVTRRAPTALHPLSMDGVPIEALPLVIALNDLLDRLDGAISSQRNFVADAAHELRTPLTALQLQVQLAGRATGDAGRTEALDELRHGLERASHVVQQLLTLARQEPGGRDEQETEEIDLGMLVTQVVADHIRLAESRDIDLGVTENVAGVLIHGEAVAIRTLLANLVDNALRYTPTGGRVDVASQRDGPWLVVKVSDSGHGIPMDERDRVFDRFYRRSGTGESGSGLGLAIVETIATRHGATVALGESEYGGLLVTVRLKAAKA